MKKNKEILKATGLKTAKGVLSMQNYKSGLPEETMKKLLYVCLFVFPIIYIIFIFVTKINSLALFYLLCLFVSTIIVVLMKKSIKQKLINIFSIALSLIFLLLMHYTQYNLIVFIIGAMLLLLYAIIATILNHKK